MNTTPADTSFTQRLQERIARSRFFTFSLLLHVVIVVLAGGAVLFHRMPEPADFAPPDGEIFKPEKKIAEPVVQVTNISTVIPEPSVTPVAAPQLPSIIVTNTTKQPTVEVTQVSVKIRDKMRQSEKPIAPPPAHAVP